MLALSLGGCAVPAAPPAALPKVSVRLLQYRSDIAPHRLQLEVVNGSSSGVVVQRARLLTSGYRTAPTWSDRVPAEIPAGATVDLPVALGPAVCGAAASPRAELTLADRDRTSTVRVPTADSHGTFAALHRADCFAERAARVASFAFTAITPEQGGTAALTLEVQPGPDAAQGLEVLQVLPTTLLSPTASRSEWTVHRRVGTRHAPIVLAAVPTRCDLHAIAEDKLGSVPSLVLRLADGSTGLVEVVPSPAIKNAVLGWVARTCATGR